MEPAPISIAVVGLGKRSVRVGLPTIVKCPWFTLKAVCDPNTHALSWFKANEGIQAFTHIEALLQYHQDCLRHGRPQDAIQAAYVAIPHNQYDHVVPLLLKHGLHVLKEKPAGIDMDELRKMQQLATANQVRLCTASQSRYSDRLCQAQKHIPSLGTLRFIEGTRKVSVMNLAEGWRSKSAVAGGGALNDIGWHLLDDVVGFVGPDAQATVVSASLFQSRVSDAEDYDCEDSAHIAMEFRRYGPAQGQMHVSCNLRISRIGVHKMDEIVIVGDQASLILHADAITVQCARSSLQQVHKIQPKTKLEDFRCMLECFHASISSSTAGAQQQAFACQDAKVTEVIEAIYRHCANKKTQSELSRGDKHQDSSDHSPRSLKYHWPKITDDLEHAVVQQLKEGISIYDNGGIFRTFETAFLQVHERLAWHALLHNSGTNALQALFYAAGFLPGDEIIFPVYTFHATASAAMLFGITPIFCDCLPDGNISPSAIAQRVTPLTKAVVITHMWGLPCNMASILSLLPRHILLLEDCSHAIGASVNGQLVGTFGDGAAWSLQGQKNISGGEGGIVLTKHSDFHYRQLLWGHYNKRCKVEIPPTHSLREYALTGAGSKNRAHPIAVSIALNQLQKLHQFQSVRDKFAARIADGLREVSFLHVPHRHIIRNDQIQHSWYAMILLFDREKAPAGLTRESFVDQLLSCGLVEVDIPRSTKPIHEEPLFLAPHLILPHIYPHPLSKSSLNDEKSFPCAQAFHETAIKLPVWAYQEDASIVDHYIRIIQVCARRCK